MPPSFTIASILILLQKALKSKNVVKVLGVYILYILLKYRSTALGAKPRKDIVGPRGLPLIGNLITILGIPRNQLAQHNTMMHRKYGKVWCYTVPKIGRIIRFNDPDILEHVLKTNFWSYEKGALLGDTVNDLLGQGIFAVDGHVFFFFDKPTNQMSVIFRFPFTHDYVLQSLDSNGSGRESWRRMCSRSRASGLIRARYLCRKAKR